MSKSFVNIFLSILLIIFLFSQLALQVGCAVIVPPEGGLRDSLPPVLTKSTPPNNTLDFPTDRFVLSFDEYVDLDNYQQNMIVSPLPVNAPTVTRKLNTITVKLRDTIQANTTYAFNFGKSIKDVNEGNVMTDFTYIFSTGSYIDSLELDGKVILAETGETDSTLTVMLHRDGDDSAVINKRPRYVARTNGAGNFHFTHLSPGVYHLYAMKDEGSYRYLNKKQLFAFADAPVTVGQQNDSLVLYAYVGDKSEVTAPPSRNRAGEKRLKFEASSGKNKQDLLDKFRFKFETPLKSFDSSKVHITMDSTYSPVTNYTWTLDTTKKVLVLNHAWKENTLYNFILEKDFATDTLGQQLLKNDTISFITRALVEYGKLTIRLRNLDLSKNPVLQFVQGGEVKKSFPLSSETFTEPVFEPGEYNLRILYDVNKNGAWDPGEFFGKHKQPELVRPLTRKVTVRANWDDTVEIIL